MKEDLKKIKLKNRIHFIDENNNVSEDNYYDVTYYSGGYAFVQEKPFGTWRLRDRKGNLSKLEFDLIILTQEGQNLIKIHNDKYRFLDYNGKISKDCYPCAEAYNCGYARVYLDERKIKQGKHHYRDLLGNLTEYPTYLGNQTYKYFKKKILLKEFLEDEKLPYDEKLVDFVIRCEKEKLREIQARGSGNSPKYYRPYIQSIEETINKYKNKGKEKITQSKLNQNIEQMEDNENQ